MRRIHTRKTYKLFRETKTKALNLTTSLVLLASSLGGGLPLFLSRSAYAQATTAPTVTAPASAVTVQSPSYTVTGTTQDSSGTVTIYTDANNDGQIDGTDAPVVTANNPYSLTAKSFSVTVPLVTGDNHFLVVALKSGSNATPSTPTSVPTITYTPALAPNLTAGDFATWDNSPAFKGIDVGFFAEDFGTVNSVTVDVTRADGSHVLKIADTGILNLLSGKTSPTAASAPIIIQPGTYNEADGYWHPQTYSGLTTASDWTATTEPTSVTVTVTGTNGTRQVTMSPLTETAGASYTNLLPDTTAPPVPTLVSPGSGTAVNKAAAILDWSDVTDPDGSNPVTYEYQSSHSSATSGPNNALTSVIYTASTGTSSQIDATGSADGTYYWQVRACDSVGNCSSWSGPWEVTIDSTAPATPQLLTPPNGSWLSTNDFYFTWSNSSDSGSPVTYEFIASQNSHTTGGVLDTSVWDNITDGNSEQNNLTQPKIHSTGAPDGTWYWQVRAIDAAGNKSSWSSVWNVTIDTHSPTVAISSPTNGQVLSVRATGGKLNLTGTASDTNFNYYYCYVTDAHGEVGTRSPQCVTAWALGTPFESAFAQTTQGTTSGSLGYIDLTGLPDGSYTVHLVAKDKAGNTTEATQPFVLDNTRPSLSFTAPTDFTKPFQSGPTVTVNGSDANGLSVLVIHVYDAATNKLLTTACTATSAELTAGQLSCDLSGLAEGTYYIKAGANDTAGNNQTITSPVLTIDKTAPKLTINPSNGTNLTPTITGTTSDATDVVTVDGQTATVSTTANGNGTYDWSYTLSTQTVGTHTITVVSTDQAGNATTETADVVITAVVTPQVLGAITTAASSGTQNNTTPVTVTVTPNNDQHVLGDSTTTPGTTGTDSNDGQVKGDSINLSDNQKKNGSAKNSGFLGLGWWWLAILAAIAALWIVLARRRDNDEA